MKNKDLKFSNFKSLPKILLVIFLIIFILQIFILLFLLIAPLATQAAKNPTLDPSCWPRNLCLELAKGNPESDAACGGTETWVRCYPGAAPIPIGVKIEGVGEVKDVAQYISLLYKYTIGIGAILAVVMIVWGGVIYLTAGGTPERIKSAKDYISNALVGLVLLFTSYLLLQTLNPDLVKLRMPRVYMIRPITLGAQICQGIEGGPTKTGNFAEAIDVGPPTSPSEYKKTKELAECNKEYYWENGGDQRCWGGYCAGMKNCAAKSKGEGFECVEGFPVIINYTANTYIHDVQFYVVCKDEKAHHRPQILASASPQGEKNSEKPGAQTFTIDMTYKDFYDKACNGKTSNIVGLFFSVFVEDDRISSGDDWYMLGKSKDKPISCTTWHQGFAMSWKNGDICSVPVSLPSPTDYMEFNQSELLSESEFSVELGRFPIVYTLDRSNFPLRD